MIGDRRVFVGEHWMFVILGRRGDAWIVLAYPLVEPSRLDLAVRVHG